MTIFRRYQSLDDLDSTKIAERQLELLRAQLQYAYVETDYFKRVLDTAGLDPSTVDFQSLATLPLLTKELIRNNFDRLLPKSIPVNELSLASTGGSTGKPLRFMRSAGVFSARKAQELYFEQWMDFHPGDKVALFVAASHFEGAIHRLKARIRNATFERMLSFDPSEPSSDYLERFTREFCQFSPKVIKCFPNSLLVFALYLKEHGIAVPEVQSISCTGETLYQWQRELFEEVFGGKVFERYATKESGIIAAECRLHDGLHIFTDGCVVEVVDDRGTPIGPGEIGRLVVTDLVNRGTPLVRYDIGDMAERSADDRCGCGSSLPKLKRILGRDRDILVDSRGVYRPGYLFVETINKRNLDGKFQIVQRSNGDLNVLLESGHNVNDVELTELVDTYKSIMGEKISVTLSIVPEISREPSGKYTYVKSEMERARPLPGHGG